ncbi:MAG TPA: four helix bundle protein [Chitinophagaceae bacterium]|nr:four helix bundle protein [Chitinophagaceae bacterium]
MNNYVESFRDLKVYKLARKLAQKIFDMTSGFPKEERHALSDQVRRSSRSVGAQIAEAWGARRYEKHFISKFTDADGEQLEPQHWIETAWDCEYVNAEQKDYYLNKYAEVGMMLSSMINKSASFCRKK